jgi:hypothetical protein
LDLIPGTVRCALGWQALHAAFTVPGLMQGIFGTKKWMRQITLQFLAEVGRKGGNTSTPEKQATSRLTASWVAGRARKWRLREDQVTRS